MKTFSVAVIALAAIAGFQPGKAQAAIKVQTVDYKQGDTTLEGWLVYDDAKQGKRPGVMVFPAWNGPTEDEKGRAEMLAKLGYVAFVADVYGKGVRPNNFKDAAAESGKYMKDRGLLRARAQAGFDQLRNNPMVDTTKLAAIGYCFGGGVVLNMARQGADLRGVASFHGSLAAVRPAAPGAIKAEIRVYTGADDKFVPSEAVEGFKKEMEAAGADVKIISYPGAVHSFTNPDATALGKKFNLPLAYNANADKDSWNDMKKFLAEIFKQ